MSPKQVMRLLKDDGWVAEQGTRGSHRQFKHPVKKGKVTVPIHGGDLKPGTLNSILKQAGLK